MNHTQLKLALISLLDTKHLGKQQLLQPMEQYQDTRPHPPHTQGIRLTPQQPAIPQQHQPPSTRVTDSSHRVVDIHSKVLPQATSSLLLTSRVEAISSLVAREVMAAAKAVVVAIKLVGISKIVDMA